VVAGLALLFIVAFAFAISSASRGRASSSQQLRPGQAAFDAANQQILVYKSATQKVGFGNTPEAEKMATEFAKTMQVMQQLAFTGGKKGGVSLSGGNFLVHCQLQGDTACFLAHVPQLRNYKDKDVRLALAKIAWSTAKAVTEEARKDKRWDLGLGLRGTLMYGVVATGTSGGEPVIEQGSAVDPSGLYRFFAPAPGPAAATAPAGGAPTPGAAPGTGSPAKIPGDAPAGNDSPAKAPPPAKDTPPATPDKP
jgi:hypothetical protein